MSERKLNLEEGLFGLIFSMSEGNPGAISVLSGIALDKGNMPLLLRLDSMNIWGAQIWIGYKDYCGEDLDKFMELVSKQDPNLVLAINIEMAREGRREKAVTGGAANSKGPRPEFTDEEMEELKKQTPPRLQNEKK